jgi:WavE lipopolysaccharide synthesis
MRDVCLLIQGPLNQTLIDNVSRNIDSVSQCVVSTWTPNDAIENGILETLRVMQEKDQRLQIVCKDYEIDYLESQNLAGRRQFLSIQNGLAVVEPRIVVKCRSDEQFALSAFLEAVASRPDTVTFVNFIVRDWLYHPFHMSDHLFSAPKDILKSALEKLFSRSEIQLYEILGQHAHTPEVLLGFHLLEQFGEVSWPVSSRDNYQRFVDHFNLFDLEDLRPYRVNANHAGVAQLEDLRALESLKSWGGYRLNFTTYRTIRAMRPNKLRGLWFKKAKPIVRAAVIRIFGRN